MEYGLIGEHLAHSYSKPIHALLGDYSYEIKSLPPDALKDFFSKKEFKGINVTIPYKKAVMPFCAAVSPVAERLGSVNTITVDASGNLKGDNTDYFGFSYMAKQAGIGFAGKQVLVLGSGGTGRTVKAVAQDAGAMEVTVVSRSGPVNYGNVYERKDADIIVNATPVGMYPHTENAPLDLSRFPSCSGVLDVTYNPLLTRLLLEAKRLGIPYANGLSMLAAQAKYTSDLFFNRTTSDGRIDEITGELTRRFTNIVLIGMPGSGKSTVGKRLAEETEKTFTDTDTLIEEKAQLSIPEIFNRFGEEYFRDMEAQVISDTGKEKGQVIATGGGAVLRHENYLNLKQNGFIVFLQRDLNKLEQAGRPLSAGMDAVEKLYENRLPLYRKYGDIEVDNNGTAEQAAETIKALFLSKPK